MADLICQGKCLYYEYPSPDLRDLRNLLSLNRKLKKLEQGYDYAFAITWWHSTSRRSITQRQGVRCGPRQDAFRWAGPKSPLLLGIKPCTDDTGCSTDIDCFHVTPFLRWFSLPGFGKFVIDPARAVGLSHS